jgi:DNA-binding NtrC family response regulator
MNAQTNILVVDDEEVVRRSYLRALAGTQCKVQAVENGEVALQAMGTRPFDVVLLDLRMPEMDGVAVLEQIKRRWPQTEVVVITGYPAVETAKQAIELGAYDYLAKPVGPDEVVLAANGAALHKRWALQRDEAS